MPVLRVVGLCMALLLGAISVPAQAADIAKIGMIDMQRVLQESKAGRDAAEALRKVQGRRNKELGSMKSRIQSAQAVVNSGTLSNEELVSTRQELEVLVEEFKASDSAFTHQMSQINRQRSETIRRDIKGIVETLGRKGGYLLIVEKKEVLYAPTSMDMTDRLIGLYDKAYEKR